MSDSYGIQYYAEWSDYPDWEDFYEWDKNGDIEATIRFSTREEAIAFLDEMDNSRFEIAHKTWRKDKKIADARQELYEKRKQCLVDNGLWIQKGELWSPLVGVMGAGREPVRGWEGRYRVVPDAEMDNPVEEDAT